MEDNEVEGEFPRFSYLFVVFDMFNHRENRVITSQAYVNGTLAMEFDTTGYGMSFALSQEHVDFLDMLGEGGWEMVSHETRMVDVQLRNVAFPQIKHYMVFKRQYDEVETEEVRTLRATFLQRRGAAPDTPPADTPTGPST